MSATSQLLGTAATVSACSQPSPCSCKARQMLTRHDSCEVSVRFLVSYAGGYVIWLLYGLSVGSTPLIVADAVGLLCAGLTLAVALSLRGSLLRPAMWASCNATPIP